MSQKTFESELFEVMGLESSVDNISYEYDDMISVESTMMYDENYIKYSEESVEAGILLKISEEYYNSGVSFESSGSFGIIGKIFKFIWEVIKKIASTIVRFFKWAFNSIKSIFTGGRSSKSVEEITSSSNPTRNMVLASLQTKVVTVPVLDEKKLEKELNDLKKTNDNYKKVADELCDNITSTATGNPKPENLDKKLEEFNKIQKKITEYDSESDREHKRRMDEIDREHNEKMKKRNLEAKARKDAADAADKAADEARKIASEKQKKEIAARLAKIKSDQSERSKLIDEQIKENNDLILKIKADGEARAKANKLRAEELAKKKLEDEEVVSKEIAARRAGRINSFIESRISSQQTIADHFLNYKQSTYSNRLQTYITEIQRNSLKSKNALDNLSYTIGRVIGEEEKTTDLYNTPKLYSGSARNDRGEGRIRGGNSGYVAYLESVRREITTLTSMINHSTKDSTEIVTSLLAMAKDNTIIENLIVETHGQINEYHNHNGELMSKLFDLNVNDYDKFKKEEKLKNIDDEIIVGKALREGKL